MIRAAPPVIRAARPGDFTRVAGLLQANHLPIAGVPESLDAFLVAERDGRLVGVIGLECYGTDALLRSAAVDEPAQGTGLGAQLVDGIMTEAAVRGIRTLWLLTTTADQWFPRFGFTVAARADVPESVRASVEFQGACPDSAIVMRRALAPTPVQSPPPPSVSR